MGPGGKPHGDGDRGADGTLLAAAQRLPEQQMGEGPGPGKDRAQGNGYKLEGSAG